MNLYLFDFDGTLTNKDSMLEYVKFINKNRLEYFLKNIVFIPIYLIFLFGFMQARVAKIIFLKIHFFDYNEDYLKRRAKEFSKEAIKFLYPGVRSYLDSIKDEKCIVSASLDLWMIDISETLNTSLICTETIFKENIFKGIKKNCNGKEKVTRIKKKYDLKKYDEIYVFGNSRGDFEMYEIGKKMHNYFK